jgi:serine/threonine protein kinase
VAVDGKIGQGVAPASDVVVLGRYRLVDKVSDTAGTELWRGHDQRLNRPVSVRFMPLEDPTTADLRAAALRASRVTDRRTVHVLDAVADPGCGCLVIVTEWLNGTSFAERLASRSGEPMLPRAAAALALEVARALEAAEAEGVTHGNLRPEQVMLTDTGDVRLRGLGVEQVLHGVEPGDDPALADVHAVGAVLYAGLTGRWPGSSIVEGVPGVPPLRSGRTPWPSRVVADVPRDLDQIAARALLTTEPPKSAGRYASVGEVAADLAAALTAPAVDLPVERERRTGIRTAGVIAVIVCTLGLAYLGLQMVLGLGGGPLTVPRTVVLPTQASTTPSSIPAASAGDRVVPIVSVADFDPFGNDRKENPQLARLAIDSNPATAWTTVHYKASDMSGKGGVGLLVDLGAPRPVSAVSLRLVGNGTDLSLLATDDPTKKLSTFTSMAQVTGAGNALTLRVPRPVTTRYLVVWLTSLPAADGSYQGGVADIRVLG